MNYKKTYMIMSSLIGLNLCNIVTMKSAWAELPDPAEKVRAMAGVPAPETGGLKQRMSNASSAEHQKILQQTSMAIEKLKGLNADDFSEEKILRALYKSYNKKKEVASWKMDKYPQAFSDYQNARELFADINFETYVAYYMPFMEGGIQKLFVLTRTNFKIAKNTAGRNLPSTMDGFIGAAIFAEKQPGKWQVESEGKYLAPTTRFDNGFNVFHQLNLIDIGKDKLGFTYHVNIPQDKHKRSMYLYLITAIGPKIKPVLVMNPEMVSVDPRYPDVVSRFKLVPSTRYTRMYDVEEYKTTTFFDTYKQKVISADNKMTVYSFDVGTGEYRRMSESYRMK